MKGGKGGNTGVNPFRPPPYQKNKIKILYYPNFKNTLVLVVFPPLI